jgi:mannose-6-phosphate isomerase-like protein (cupin superfamily)
MQRNDGLIVVPRGTGRRSGDIEFLAMTEDTQRLTICTILIDPWSSGVAIHTHAGEDDAFYVLEGELTFVGADGPVTAPAGTFVLAPEGVEHGFHNRTGEPARLLNIHSPTGFDRRILASRGEEA